MVQIEIGYFKAINTANIKEWLRTSSWNSYMRLISWNSSAKMKYLITRLGVYKTRGRLFHPDFQTLRSGLKNEAQPSLLINFEVFGYLI